MKRRDFLMGASILTVGSFTTYALPSHLMVSSLPTSQSILTGITAAHAAAHKTEAWAAKLIASTESQIGVTQIYDPAYVRLSFPNGDIPRGRGVCTDVIVRAYRDAFDFDLQKAVNSDMKNSFSAYPRVWGLKRPDRNIDHRRVPNLQTFFKRQGAALPISDRPHDYLPGDIVSQISPGNRPHIALVTNRPSLDGARPLLVHNIGAGAQLQDSLFIFKVTGRYRFKPADAT